MVFRDNDEDPFAPVEVGKETTEAHFALRENYLGWERLRARAKLWNKTAKRIEHDTSQVIGACMKVLKKKRIRL